jgi:hypothetical protein
MTSLTEALIPSLNINLRLSRLSKAIFLNSDLLLNLVHFNVIIAY